MKNVCILEGLKKIHGHLSREAVSYEGVQVMSNIKNKTRQSKHATDTKKRMYQSIHSIIPARKISYTEMRRVQRLVHRGRESSEASRRQVPGNINHDRSGWRQRGVRNCDGLRIRKRDREREIRGIHLDCALLRSAV